MALGLNAMLLGAECFVLDRIELSKSFTSIVGSKEGGSADRGVAGGSSIFQNSGYQFPTASDPTASGSGRMFRPREWMPWSFIAAGAVIVMYTSAYSKKTA